MKKQIEEWLGDKKRTHAAGVELFKSSAPDDFKKKYLEFIDKKDVVVMSSEHSMLINKLTFIVQNNLVADAGKSEGEKEDAKTVKFPSTDGKQKVSVDALPKDLKAVYVRIQEIAPVYAKLLADVSNEGISNEERKQLADELCSLDEERQTAWQKIDDWTNGKSIELEEKEDAFSENELVKGIQIANRILRLKEGIRRAKVSFDNKKASAKVKASAQERIDQYAKELVELESLVSEGK